MRVLHVNHLLDPVSGGGTAERTFQISRYLALQGTECTILTLDIGQVRGRTDGLPGLNVEALPCLHPRFFLPKVRSRQIDALVDRSDIVQLFGNWTLLNLLVWRACIRLRRPYVFCPAGSLRPFGRSLLMKHVYSYLVTRGVIRDATHCVCITEDEQAQFMKLGARAPQLVTIQNGIDPDQYRLAQPAEAVAEFRASLGIGASPFILFLGRLNPIKGPDILLRAFSAMAERWSEHHLVFGGPDGGMLSKLKDMAIQMGLGARVHFPGFVGQTAKAAALCAADLLVIPSRSEAMSIVVLEAGACGCPTLFTDACGLAAFQARGAGRMVSVDVEQMAVALEQLLAQPLVRKAQGELLREIVMAEYLWCGQAARYLALYEQVLQHGATDAG